MYDSQRMQSVQTPIIPVVGELIRANPGTISLGQGVAYYGPPPEAGRYIEKFFADPQNHKYKLVQGIPELLEAIESKLAAENGFASGPAGGSSSPPGRTWALSTRSWPSPTPAMRSF